MFAAVFAVGGITGYWIRGPLDTRPPLERAERDRLFRDRVVRDLGLTPEQETPFFEAMRRHRRLMRDRNDSIRAQAQERMRNSLDSLRIELADILTPEQLALWEEHTRRAMRRGGPQR